jgi:hypothetical protein
MKIGDRVKLIEDSIAGAFVMNSELHIGAEGEVVYLGLDKEYGILAGVRWDNATKQSHDGRFFDMTKRIFEVQEKSLELVEKIIESPKTESDRRIRIRSNYGRKRRGTKSTSKDKKA